MVRCNELRVLFRLCHIAVALSPLPVNRPHLCSDWALMPARCVSCRSEAAWVAGPALKLQLCGHFQLSSVVKFPGMQTNFFPKSFYKKKVIALLMFLLQPAIKRIAAAC